MTIRQFISEIDAKTGVKPIHVGVSSLAFSEGDRELKTTLGSCVAVIIYGPDTSKKCSMSHYLLANSEDRKLRNSNEKYKYGNLILTEQIETMRRHYGSAKLYAKIVGGSNIMTASDNALLKDIGSRNVEMAKNMLFENKIIITGEQTGGYTARALRFFPVTNTAWVYEFQDKKELTM